MCIDVDFLKAAFISLKNYFNFWKLTRSDVPRTDDGWAMLGYNRGQTSSVDNLDHQFMWVMGWWHASMVHYWLSWVKTLSMIRLTLLEPIKTSMPLSKLFMEMEGDLSHIDAIIWWLEILIYLFAYLDLLGNINLLIYTH